jgi:hypothetical protein
MLVRITQPRGWLLSSSRCARCRPLPHPALALWRTVFSHRDEHEAEAGYQSRHESKRHSGEHPRKDADELGGKKWPEL